MTNEDGSMTLQLVKDNSRILKVQMQSRHIGKKIYRCFIDYNPNTVGLSGIQRYACECPNGLRTVGCCSHVAATIYYLSHARYLSRIIKPAEILSKPFEQNSVEPTINEDSDED